MREVLPTQTCSRTALPRYLRFGDAPDHYAKHDMIPAVERWLRGNSWGTNRLARCLMIVRETIHRCRDSRTFSGVGGDNCPVRRRGYQTWRPKGSRKMRRRLKGILSQLCTYCNHDVKTLNREATIPTTPRARLPERNFPASQWS